MLQCSHRRKFISHLPLSFSSPIGVCCSKTRLHVRMAQQRVEVSPRLATAGRGVWVRCHDWPVCQNVWVRCRDLLRPTAAFGSDAAAYHDLLRCLGAMVRLATTCRGVWEWCRVQGWDWDLPLHLRGMLQSATVFGRDAVTCHDLPLCLTVMPQIAKVCRGVWGLYCNLPQCLGVRPRFASLLLRLGVMSWPGINPWSKKPCIYSIVYSQTVVLIFLTHTLNRTNWKALSLFTFVEMFPEVRWQQSADAVIRNEQVKVSQQAALGFVWFVLRLQDLIRYDLPQANTSLNVSYHWQDGLKQKNVHSG